MLELNISLKPLKHKCHSLNPFGYVSICIIQMVDILEYKEFHIFQKQRIGLKNKIFKLEHCNIGEEGFNHLTKGQWPNLLNLNASK